MVVMVILPDCFALGDLEQRDLGRHQPTKQEPEPELIAKGDNELGFPVQRSGVPVVVLSRRNVLHKLLLLL
ncbi:hypothetical protein PR202_ga03470 [Eleusine coracana subsp. coracana]|uniref:Uncharacterized protein n=1 Tax=Eleusine coracana subsp. coracana TaxID=191504 RepID=A0AAV5BMF9_ELECO|nr:hypothetical protein PR202_ga03470 [Eleusine coracana subsp. coracana]